MSFIFPAPTPPFYVLSVFFCSQFSHFSRGLVSHSPCYHLSQYSVDGLNFTQSYMIIHRKPFGTYSFIALDACPSPGIKRPLNFFGLITPVSDMRSYSVSIVLVFLKNVSKILILATRPTMLSKRPFIQ